MAELEYYLQWIMKAQDGQLGEDDLKRLETELEGALVGVGNRSRQKYLGPIRNRDWDLLAGIVRRKVNDDQVRAAGGMSVNAVANATASVALSIAQHVSDTYREIQTCDGLTNEQKQELAQLVVDMQDATDRQDTETFSRKAARWLENTANLVAVWQAFAPAICTMLTLLVKQAPVTGTY